jgi:hypothetical protein
MHGAQTKKELRPSVFATVAREPPAMNPPLRMRSCIHNGYNANEIFPEGVRDLEMHADQQLQAMKCCPGIE